MSNKKIEPTIYQEILNDLKTDHKNTEQLNYIIEKSFRFAMNSNCTPDIAIKILKKLYKIEGLNPRYSYHIARIYFSVGDLENALQWFGRAAKTFPGSHRIWAHISQVHSIWYSEKKKNKKNLIKDNY